MSSSSLNNLSNWSPNTAADSSILGTVIGFRCAGRDFPMRNVQWILSSTSTSHRYDTAPCAIWEASAKLCNSANFKFPNSGGLMHLVTAICERLGNCSFHFSHLWHSLSPTGSSQPSFCLQRSCSNVFAGRTIGARKPSGSYT